MNRSLRTVLTLCALVGFMLLVRYASVPRADEGAPADVVRTEHVDPLGGRYDATPPGLMGATASLGVLLIGAWLVGRLFSTVRLPKISGFLIFGLLMGPSVLGVITNAQLPYLQLVNDLAIAMIALTAGGEIRLAALRLRARAVTVVTACQVLITFVGVGALVYALQGTFRLSVVDTTAGMIAIAAVVAVVATSGSPAVVIALLTETRAKGPLSELSLMVIVCMDLFLIVLFAVVMAVAGALLAEQLPGTSGGGLAAGGAGALPLYLLQHLGGSLVAGIVAGLLMSWYMHKVRAHLAIFVILACFGMALVSAALGLEALIVALVAGMLVQNTWPEGSRRLFHTVEGLSLPVYCLFFALAGAKTELSIVGSLWVATVILVCARAAMLIAGSTIGARVARIEPPARGWLWTSFISQAGLSLALAAIVQRTFAGAPFADNLYNLVLAMIVMNELVGPILFRLGLSRAGEIESEPGT